MRLAIGGEKCFFLEIRKGKHFPSGRTSFFLFYEMICQIIVILIREKK
jgi:hypothetical protein